MTANGKNDKFYFDTEAADKAVRFIETHLVHVEDIWTGKPFLLLDWQRKITRDIFGWKEKGTGRRRYKQVYIEVPKKNGKTSWAAAIAIYCLFSQAKISGKVYSCASKREQASIVFNYAAKMLKASPTLSKLIGKEPGEGQVSVYRNPQKIEVGTAEFKPLSADAKTEDGLNPSVIIVDELHRAADGDMFNLMQSATIARQDALMITITTAGDDLEGPCFKQRKYAEDVLSGKAVDDAFYGVIFAAEKDDDPWKESTWRKANPSLGEIISVENFAQIANRAKQQPSYRYDFLRYNLNIWNQKKGVFLSDDAWMACKGKIDLEALASRPCWVGVDLANREDFAAVVQVFLQEDGGYAIVPHFWIPRDAIEEHPRKLSILEWERNALLTLTEGNVNDYPAIEAFLASLSEQYEVKEIAFDPKDAAQMMQNLTNKGIVCVSVPQSYTGMNWGMVQLERLVLTKALKHDGNSVLRWMNANMVSKKNGTDLIMPERQSRADKIDGMVALVLALGRATLGAAEEVTESVYEHRGLVIC